MLRWPGEDERHFKRLGELSGILDADFSGQEPLRQRPLNKTAKHGNDDDLADRIRVRIFDTQGGRYRVEMLPTNLSRLFRQRDRCVLRDLILCVAGYSDCFCNLSRELQEEIVNRTEHAGF